jgi:hypothetical protein
LLFPKLRAEGKGVDLNKKSMLIKLAAELEACGFKVEIDYKREKIRII